MDIDIIQSNLFSCFKRKRIFDIIVFNIPYLDIKPRDSFDLTICDYKKETLKRFLIEAHEYLKEDGCILLAYYSLGDLNTVEKLFHENGWNFEVMIDRRLSFLERIVVYNLKKASSHLCRNHS